MVVCAHKNIGVYKLLKKKIMAQAKAEKETTTGEAVLGLILIVIAILVIGAILYFGFAAVKAVVVGTASFIFVSKTGRILALTTFFGINLYHLLTNRTDKNIRGTAHVTFQNQQLKKVEKEHAAEAASMLLEKDKLYKRTQIQGLLYITYGIFIFTFFLALAIKGVNPILNYIYIGHAVLLIVYSIAMDARKKIYHEGTEITDEELGLSDNRTEDAIYRELKEKQTITQKIFCRVKSVIYMTIIIVNLLYVTGIYTIVQLQLQ